MDTMISTEEAIVAHILDHPGFTEFSKAATRLAKKQIAGTYTEKDFTTELTALIKRAIKHYNTTYRGAEKSLHEQHIARATRGGIRNRVFGRPKQTPYTPTYPHINADARTISNIKRYNREELARNLKKEIAGMVRKMR